MCSHDFTDVLQYCALNAGYCCAHCTQDFRGWTAALKCPAQGCSALITGVARYGRLLKAAAINEGEQRHAARAQAAVASAAASLAVELKDVHFEIPAATRAASSSSTLCIRKTSTGAFETVKSGMVKSGTDKSGTPQLLQKAIMACSQWS